MINPNEYLTVAAYQGSIKEKNPESNLDTVIQLLEEAETRHIDILCLPECFLQGYFPDHELARANAINLKSIEFSAILKKLQNFKYTTLLLGLNEQKGNQLFNTVVVIEKGECIGKYRKAYSYTPFDYYTLGRDFPVFEKKGIKYSIVICLDSFYREPSWISALNGARIIFCPMFNRVAKSHETFQSLHRNHFIARAFDNHCWFVASDIIWNDETQHCPGYACIVDDKGDIIMKSEPFQQDLLVYSIPIESLQKRKMMRLRGNPELFYLCQEAYKKTMVEKNFQ